MPADCVPFLDALANILSEAIQSRQTHEMIRHQALHDELTGLPNRTLFLDRVTHALARNDRRQQRLAVLFIDLDRFKLVNDSLGHETGDGLLRLLAPRLASAIRASDTLARLGGDEFAVLCEDLPSEQSATRIAEKLLTSLEEPVVVAGEQQVVSASVGIAISTGESSASDLLRDADAAMYHAKTAGRARAELFDKQMHERVLGRVRTESALRAALTNEHEIFVHYQPLVSLRTGQIVGAEALARWRHPDLGPVSPLEFIAVAEDSGLIHQLGAHIIRRAVRECAVWQAHPDFAGIAVNISARQLVRPDEVATLVTQAIANEQIAPGFLTIEITESLLIEHLEIVQRALKSLRSLGVHLSLDDFGTGYSSLSYLRDLPMDSVKIDRSLITDIIHTPRAADLAAAIIDMGHALELEVIAEGVETREQAALLQALGCDIAQGYYFAKPMAPEALTALLHEQPGWLPGSVRAAANNHHGPRDGVTRRVASGIWMLDEANVITYVSSAMAAIVGCEPEELLGKPITDFIEPASVTAASDNLTSHPNGTNAARDMQLRVLDGRQAWISVAAHSLPTAEGEHAGTIATVSDITTRKAGEARALQLAALVESAGEAIITLTPTGEIATWNEAAERLYGYSRAEATGQHEPTLLAGDPAARERLLGAVARGEVAQAECRDIRKSGDPVEVSVTDSPIRDADGRVVAIARVARDITERKAAEAESARLAAIVESSADAIISLNTDGVIETWNKGAEQLYGYTPAEAVGQPAPTLLSHDPGKRAQLLARGASDVLRDVEVTDVAKDGSSVEVSGTSSPILDSAGQITGVSLILHDMRERRRLEAERRRMERELAIAQKLEAVGALAAGIAHEINTPIQYIGDSARFLRDATKDLEQLVYEYRTTIDAIADPEHSELRQKIQSFEDVADLDYLRERVPAAFDRLLDGVERVSTIVKAMKTFGHISDTEEQAPADLNEAVRRH